MIYTPHCHLCRVSKVEDWRNQAAGKVQTEIGVRKRGRACVEWLWRRDKNGIFGLTRPYFTSLNFTFFFFLLLARHVIGPVAANCSVSIFNSRPELHLGLVVVTHLRNETDLAYAACPPRLTLGPDLDVPPCAVPPCRRLQRIRGSRVQKKSEFRLRS